MKRSKRHVMRFTFLLLLPVLVIACGIYFYAFGGRIVSTHNAYVRADVVAISSEVDGRIKAVHVNDNQYVEQGQILFEIDALPFRIELEASDAELALVRQQVDSLRAQYREIESEIRNCCRTCALLEVRKRSHE